MSDWDDLLTGSAAVYRPTHSRDALGVSATTWELLSDAVPCRMMPSEHVEVVVAGQARAVERFDMYVRASDAESIEPGFEAEVGGRRYRVLGVADQAAAGEVTKCRVESK